MPRLLAPLLSTFAGLGTAAKVAAATTALAVTVGAAGGAAVVLDLTGGTAAGATVARAGPVQVPAGEPSPTTVAAPLAAAAPAGPATPAQAATPAAPPATKAPATRSAPAPAPPTTVAAAPATSPRAAATVASPAATGVPRRVPSTAEVDAAIKALPKYVKTFLTPTRAQVAELGDRVCTAFDEGQTFAQVKDTGLDMVTQLPRTTVMPGGADWVVRTTVTLYCPGHAAKLV